jgi:hypothetical protein
MSLYDKINPPKQVTITYKLTDISSYKFVIDCTLELTHNNSCTTTNSPVENGTAITDHVILNPRTITMSGFVSNDKYRLFAFNFPYQNEDSQTKKAYDIFNDIYKNKYLVSIDTGLEVYENMVIESMSFPRSAENINALRFSISLKEVVLVQSETTALPDNFYKEDVKSKATSKKKTQGGKEALTQKPGKDELTSTAYDNLATK